RHFHPQKKKRKAQKRYLQKQAKDSLSFSWYNLRAMVYTILKLCILFYHTFVSKKKKASVSSLL
ncbi:hypothetical protein J6U78_05285, partial [bacterium]|nr:hypothetical protein [bacterium]